MSPHSWDDFVGPEFLIWTAALNKLRVFISVPSSSKKITSRMDRDKIYDSRNLADNISRNARRYCSIPPRRAGAVIKQEQESAPLAAHSWRPSTTAVLMLRVARCAALLQVQPVTLVAASWRDQALSSGAVPLRKHSTLFVCTQDCPESDFFKQRFYSQIVYILIASASFFSTGMQREESA